RPRPPCETSQDGRGPSLDFCYGQYRHLEVPGGLVYHDDEIMKIYDHQQEISLVRVEALEKEVKIWQDRAETSEQRVEDLQEALDRTKDGVHEHQVHHEDTEAPMRVASAIEAIAIYETRTHMARDLMNWVERQDDKVTENASNKRKWEGDHDKGFSQQRNKGYKVIGAHVVEPSDKKGYARNLPWLMVKHHIMKASNHEDASDTGAAPKQQQQVIPQTTAISNIKLPILKKEEYDIWAMEMEHYLEYIDNDVWKVIQNGNSKKRISTGKDGVVRILPPVSPAEIHAVEKERKARTILLMAIPKEHLRRFHGMDDAKEIWEAIRTRFGGNANSKKMQKAVLKQQFKRDSFYQDQEAGKQEKNQMGLLTMDDGIVNWGEHTEDEETNHALMAISSSSEKTLDSWKDSSKNLWRLINSGMSSNSKIGLGYEIQSNNEVLSYEEEMNFSVFNCSEEDSVGKPLYSRFIKTNDFKGVPHPLSGDYTPKPQEEIDESLYVYGKKGPQEPEPSVSDDRSSEYSTCQSNDSAGSIGTSSEHSFDPESEISRVPKEVYVSKPLTTNAQGVSAPKSKEVEPSCVSHIKSPRQPIKDQETPKVNRKNWNAMKERELGEGYSFTKKKCFVCGSLSHLIKDCDYYEKKMARKAEFKKQRVFNTGNRMAKPVWINDDRINHANQFVPRSVQLNTDRPNINSVRPNINTDRTNINSVRPRVNTVNSNVNTVRSRQPVPTRTSTSFSPKRPQGNWGSAVKTSAGYNWRNTIPNSNCNGGPTFIRTDHPLKNMIDRGIFDSGCSGHMTGNKDQLEDFEEFNGGSVTFGVEWFSSRLWSCTFSGGQRTGYPSNSGVTCEDEAKRRNSGAKMKTFEENCYLLLYAVSSKEDTAYQRQLICTDKAKITRK
ncbi:hypothetical protein Tco_0662707, partial [Tanacetum coccineum]